MEFESSAWWLFADQLPDSGALMEFVELQSYGKAQVLVFLGKIGERVGDWKLFPSKVINLKDLTKQLGKEDSAWFGKRFKLMPNSEKKAVILSLV